MFIERPYTGIGDENSKGYLTLRIFPDGTNHFQMFSPKGGNSTSIRVEESRESIRISFEGEKQAHILQVQLSSNPDSVMLDNKPLSPPEDYFFDAEKAKLIIKTDSYSHGVYTIYK